MLSAEQNELLTRVEGDAPMGALLREYYWVPALVSSQLVADGAPVRSRLLGRDHVAFRDSDGRVGFFDEACPHRGTSLVLARNEECGLRCIFHGWKIDVSGTVVDAPTHGANAEAFAAKVAVRHYPTFEGGGIVWVWLGSEPAPSFPHLPFTVLPDRQVWTTITKAYCNWVQGLEATLDSAHIGFLHAGYISQSSDAGANTRHSLEVLAPRYEVEHTSYGLDASAFRPLPDGTTYLRTTKWVFPFVSLVPGAIFISVPIDDHHHNLIYGAWSTDDEVFYDGLNVPEARRETVVGERPYDPHDFGGFSAGRDENYGQDRDAMAKGHFSGFIGNLVQEDMVAQASMGPIVDRTIEQLSTSDVAIIHARRLLLESAEDARQGRAPVGTGRDLDHRDVIPVDTILPAAS